mgnify:FL=1
MLQTLAFAQNDSKITIKQKDITAVDALKAVERQSKMSINYSDSELKGKKIAFYNFSPNFPYRKELADLIRRKGYTVASSVYNPYADIRIDTIGPKEWAGIFRYCDIIITERFHDSLFALRNCKPVIAIDWEKDRFSSTGDSKTYRILKDYNQQNYHFILEDKNQLASIIDKIPQLMSDFDTARIIRKNEEYVTLAMNLLKVIKQNYDEFLRLH